MSEEEIIKEIGIIKETLIDILNYDLNIYKEDIYNLDTKQVSAIFGLLDLYTKEKEKNKALVLHNLGCFVEGQEKMKNKVKKIIKSRIRTIQKWVKEDKKGLFLDEYTFTIDLLSEILEEFLKEN